MKKRLQSLLLTITMLFSLVPTMGITALAGATPDYTIVLSDGQAYKNSVSDANIITSAVADMGLTYNANVWTMNGFNFTTTAKDALSLKDLNVAIKVKGTNTITCTPTGTAADALMCKSGSSVTINGAATGTNTLTITTQGSTKQNAEISAIDAEDATLSIGDNVTVNAIAGAGDGFSYGFYGGELAISGTGKMIAQAVDAAIIATSRPNVTIKNTGTETSPTWDDAGGTYKNGSAMATDVTMTAGTVAKTDLTITVNRLTYLYDNTNTKSLSASDYQVSGIKPGDTVQNVTITTNSANAGIYDEYAYSVSCEIVNSSGEDTKDNYNIIANKTNDIEITKRTITVVADSASKVYDGTALTCDTFTVLEGDTEEYKLLAGENVSGVGFTPDSTITHVGSTANKIDATDIVITKPDSSDSSMNYNFYTEDGTLTVTARGVLLYSTSAEKHDDGTPLQNPQVAITGFHYGETGEVIIDENAGFLAGDGCTYDFVNDNIVIDKDGNILAWTVSEQSDTAYGQREIGTSKNEFNYNNFTSVYYNSYETDYDIVYGGNQESLGLSKQERDLYGDLTVLPTETPEPQEQSDPAEEDEEITGISVEIKMTDYSWTYDYQAKTNGYFDNGYTVIVKANGEKTETVVKHNDEGAPIPLLNNETIVVTVTGEDGEDKAVHHVGDDKQNEATYKILRSGVDVTAERESYYNISTSGGKLQILPRPVTIISQSATKVYDNEELTANCIYENGFIFGEGAAYEVTGKITEVGSAANTFAISELLTDTRVEDYTFDMQEGSLIVVADDNGKQAIANTNDLIKLNKAFNGNGIECAESETIKNILGNKGFVNVALLDIETQGSVGASKVVGYTFDVTPYTAIGTKAATPLSSKITFRLPLNNIDGFKYADIYHEDDFVEQIDVKNLASGSIEVSATKYSEYSYTLTNTRRGSSSSGGGSVDSYAVTVSKTTNGSVTVSPKNAYPGQTVTITVNPNTGYTLDSLTVLNSNGKEVTLTTQTKSYTFKMPSSDVTVKASFIKDSTATDDEDEDEDEDADKEKEEITPATKTFSDVLPTDWYYSYVNEAYEKGYMTGVSDTKFAPNDSLTRAMFVTILYRIEGEPAFMNDLIFDDVEKGSYYEKAVVWANGKGIVSGVSETKFAPNEKITREQIATILYRYAKYKGIDTESITADTNTLSFNDIFDVSDWAAAGMHFCIAADIISGDGENINPKANATRAEMAAMISRFMKIMK